MSEQSTPRSIPQGHRRKSRLRENMELAKNGDLRKETERIPAIQQLKIKLCGQMLSKLRLTKQLMIASADCVKIKKKQLIIDLVSACSKIAQTDYKEQHNEVASMLNWNLCQKI